MTDGVVSLREYLSHVPDDDAWAQDAASRFRGLTPAERFRELSLVNAWMDAILGEMEPSRTDGEAPFWRLWKDSIGGGAR